MKNISEVSLDPEGIFVRLGDLFFRRCFNSTVLHSATKYRGNRRSSSFSSATRLLKKEKAIPSALQLVSSDLRIHTIISK